MSALFTPFKLKDVTLRNRIAVAPMCQYSAEDGLTNEWHQVHYPSMARGGAGLVIVEATAVSPEGRITPNCTGLWNDRQAQGMAQIAASIKAAGAVPGIQIAHAGRKASANRPWEGDDHIAAGDSRGWQTLAPSAIAFGHHLPKVPKAMTTEDITRVKVILSPQQVAHVMQASNGSNCILPTAISARAFSHRILTSAQTSMAAVSPAAVASCWRPLRRCAKCGRKTCR